MTRKTVWHAVPCAATFPLTALAALNVIALLTVAAGLRLWQLDRLPGLNGDEAWYGVMALRWLDGEAIPWRTPTGNPLNPFFLLPLIGLHACWEPNIALLRTPAAVSGVLACAANYEFCRRVFDRRTAIVSTVVLAVLPINLAYSRFAWDASQSLLLTVCVLYAAHLRPARRGLVAGIIALIGAVWVHPTNVFAAPLAVLPWLYDHRQTLSDRLLPMWLKYRDQAGLLGGMAFGLAMIRTPGNGLAFGLNCLRLLSGATAYRFISGGLPDAAGLPGFADIDIFDVAALLVVAPAVYGFARLLLGRRERADVCLAWSMAIMLAGFFVIAGPGALQPHFERYAIVLVAPSVLVASRGIVWWLGGGLGSQKVPAGFSSAREQFVPAPATAGAIGVHILVGGCGWLLLASFWFHYIHCFEVTGGRSHRTFSTAACEPKAAALKIIQAESAPAQPTWVIADEWWLIWPLRYLAGRHPNVHVFGPDDLPADALNAESGANGLWCAQFIGASAPAQAAQPSPDDQAAYRRVVCDLQGRPLISLVRLRPRAGTSWESMNLSRICQECGFPLRPEFDNGSN